jgi:hypothetical protein
MITLSELKKKSLRLYEKALLAYFDEPIAFPLSIPFSKKLDKTQGASFIFEQQREIIINSKAILGFGYTVELKENKKTKQSEIISIYFESLSDLLQFTDKTNDYNIFERNAKDCLNQVPELFTLFQKYPKIILDQNGNWADLLKVCQYFIQNPKPDLYVRNLPISVHSKFIEDNQSILKILLDFLVIEYVNVNERNFFKRYNLQIEEPLVKIRFLDNDILLHPKLSQMSVWISEFQVLNLDCERVIVIENLTTFLSFPKLSNSLALWGGGFAVNLLADVDWLKSKELYYWGDIDVHGFQILSQFRSHYPKAKSILMDNNTLQKYYENGKGGDFNVIPLDNLSNSELEVYEMVLENNLRLEQERIPLSAVKEIF